MEFKKPFSNKGTEQLIEKSRRFREETEKKMTEDQNFERSVTALISKLLLLSAQIYHRLEEIREEIKRVQTYVRAADSVQGELSDLSKISDRQKRIQRALALQVRMKCAKDHFDIFNKLFSEIKQLNSEDRELRRLNDKLTKILQDHLRKSFKGAELTELELRRALEKW